MNRTFPATLCLLAAIGLAAPAQAFTIQDGSFEQRLGQERHRG